MRKRVLWREFCAQAMAEGFRTIQSGTDQAGGRTCSTLLAADPKRFLLLYADSDWTAASQEVVNSATVSGFVEHRQGQNLLELIPEGFSSDAPTNWPFVQFSFRFGSIQDFSLFRDPKRLAAFCKWKPISTAVVSSTGQDPTAEWEKFKREAPKWVKEIIG